MGLPPCFHLQDEVFPRVRAEASRRLALQGWSQSRIAQAIGVSQAMVSKYQARAPDDDSLVRRLTEELLRGLDRQAPGPSSWCQTLADPRGPALDAAMADLLAAERTLLGRPPLRLVPQIGMNLALALPDARSPEDILSFPARMVAADERLTVPAPPRLGASGHLARCLLAHQAADPAVHALGSLAGGPAIAAAARGFGTVKVLDADADREAAYGEVVGPGTLAVHDPGGFGIEPCLYLAAPDAATLCDRILSLHEALP